MNINLKQGCLLIMSAYIVISSSFYFIAKEQLAYSLVSKEMSTSEQLLPLGEIVEGMTVVQPFILNADNLESISLYTATYDRMNVGQLTVQIIDLSAKLVLREKDFDLTSIPNSGLLKFNLENPIQDVNGKMLAIKLTSNGEKGNAVTVWQKNNLSQGQALLINGYETDKILCFSLIGRSVSWVGQYYFYVALLVGFILGIYLWHLILAEKKGRICLGLRVIDAFTKYRFLLSQLITRDFKTKYRRSVLGILWSFLNPLLTMTVQYVVFSTLFKTDISNFPVYLLIGIVFFSFFLESTSMSLMSIVGNANLITKVYMPKYIYPVSRVLSSSINFLLSMIPLLIVVIFTKTPFTLAYLLLPFIIVCLVAFCIGMGMLLSSAMVYFRDTQFIWSVLSMLWMYSTPIFYPVSIIPEKFILLYKINPLYHFIDFSRVVIMQGVSPEPQAYVICASYALIMLVIGGLIFNATQNGFVMHI